MESTLVDLCVERVDRRIDRRIDSIEAKENILYTGEVHVNKKTKMEPCKEMTIGNETPTLNTCGLFNDLDILHSLEDTESLDQICPDDAKFPLGLLDELNIKSLEPDSLPLESLLDIGESSSCMDNPFFEQFMDLDHLFPELPLLDTLNMAFEVDQTSPVAASDICQSDVVTVATGSPGGDYMEVPSPGSEVIDVVSLVRDAEVSSSTADLSDVALSPESVIDIMSVEEDPGSLLSSAYQVVMDCDQTESTSDIAAEEITVIQTSDALTLLTQELMQPSTSYASDHMPEERQLVKDSESLPTVTVDIDELFSLSHSLEFSDSVVLLSEGDLSSSESVVSSSEVSVKAQPKQKRKRSCSSESSNLPEKKVKCENTNKDSARSELLSTADVLDKRTVRRLKNNVASKHARAARKQKEQDLFQQEEELEKSNAELRKQVEELEQLATKMRKVLVEKLSGVTCPV
ncbi:hypothetical protein ACROYT_G000259 [Oculina patagonica]